MKMILKNKNGESFELAIPDQELISASQYLDTSLKANVARISIVLDTLSLLRNP